MSSWLALMVSVLAGILVGVPVGRWVTRMETQDIGPTQRYARALAEFDGWFFGAVVGLLAMAVVSTALCQWLTS